MSSSYFDAQPARSRPANDLLSALNAETPGRIGLLSPQIAQILDSLELDEKSSSDDEAPEISADGDSANQDPRRGREPNPVSPTRQKSSLKSEASSPAHSNKRVQLKSSPRQHRPGIGSVKEQHAARFHSLRSILFSSRIEDNIQKSNEQRMKAEAASKWKTEYDQRKGLNRPKTPETSTPPKEGLVGKFKMGLKRIASKDSAPTMQKIAEDDNVSTASDDDLQNPVSVPDKDDKDGSVSDPEELVRWVSRRDPPSDGEAAWKKADLTNVSKHDSSHESLGQSDVDELVRWVSRKESPEIVGDGDHGSYSDASTETDSGDDASRKESMDQYDIDELVRWVSRKDGLEAGPVLKKKDTVTQNGSNESSEELVSWVTRRDDTSGESDTASQEDLSTSAQHLGQPNKSVNPGSTLKEEVSHEEPEPKKSKNELTIDDVDELVRWVSRKN